MLKIWYTGKYVFYYYFIISFPNCIIILKKYILIISFKKKIKQLIVIESNSILCQPSDLF